MTSRRKFLKSSLITSAALTSAQFTQAKEYPSFQELEQLEGEDYWEQVRNMFPIPKDQAYFNTGTLGVSPYPVLDALTNSIRSNAAKAATTDYKGEGPLLLSGYEAFVEERKAVAGLINADYKEISLIQNATVGMNMVAHGLDLKKKDEILQTNQEHGGGSSTWKLLAKRNGLVYKEVQIPVPANDPDEIVDRIFQAVTSKTRVIAIPHIISVYGVITPVKEICKMARERNILTVLDGAQTIGQIQVDVKDIGCDTYFSSLHKWLLAPGGSGVLYVNKELQPKLWTTLASYNWENEEDHGFRLQQYGTGLPGIVHGMHEAIQFHNGIGPTRWTDRVKELGDHLRTGLSKIDKIEIHSSIHDDMCAGITTYKVPGISGPDVQKELWTRAKLQPRSVGKELVRHSTHIYNSKSQINQALEILTDLANKG